MKTRLPPYLFGPRQQRMKVFQVRRGASRRALQRMINCRACCGMGFVDFPQIRARVICAVCGGGYTPADMARAVAAERSRRLAPMASDLLP